MNRRSGDRPVNVRRSASRRPPISVTYHVDPEVTFQDGKRLLAIVGLKDLVSLRPKAPGNNLPPYADPRPPRFLPYEAARRAWSTATAREAHLLWEVVRGRASHGGPTRYGLAARAALSRRVRWLTRGCRWYATVLLVS
jgi:hypothetical protein